MMSSISDGLSYVGSLTAQINSLKTQAANSSSTASSSIPSDPNQILLNLQQSFDQILNNFLSSSDQSNDNSLLSNASQINASSANSSSIPSDPNVALLTFQQNFNTVVDTFSSPVDQENYNEEFDPFSSWTTYQTSINNLNNPTAANNSADSYTSLQNILNINSYNGGFDPFGSLANYLASINYLNNQASQNNTTSQI